MILCIERGMRQRGSQVMRVLTLSVWLALGALPAGGRADALRAGATFVRLSSLVGTWKGVGVAGRELTVNYRLSAADTVLVETWSLGPERESLTLYHLDGADLVATHYCPLGNQPTLRLVASDDSHLVFEFRSATGLAPGENHQVRFEIRLDGRDTFWRSETYHGGDGDSTEAVTFRRAGQVSREPAVSSPRGR